MTNGINWDSIAKSMGYVDRKVMWKALYETNKLSIAQLSSRFGVGTNTIRTQLAQCSVVMRERGGPNFQKVKMDPELAERCAREGTQSVADALGVSYTTLHKQLKTFNSPSPSEDPETSE